MRSRGKKDSSLVPDHRLQLLMVMAFNYARTCNTTCQGLRAIFKFEAWRTHEPFWRAPTKQEQHETDQNIERNLTGDVSELTAACRPAVQDSSCFTLEAHRSVTTARGVTSTSVPQPWDHRSMAITAEQRKAGPSQRRTVEIKVTYRTTAAWC